MKSKITMLILSLVIAFGLWFYVISVISPDSEITITNVKVDVVGKVKLQESGLIVTSDTDNITVDLVLTGNRTDLMKLDRDSFIATADISSIDKAKLEQPVPITVTAPGNVTVETQYDYITVRVEKLVTNTEVPLNLVYDESELAPGYTLKKSGITYPEFIAVAGPESLMQTVDRAEAVVDLSTRQDGLYDESLSYVLYDENGKALYDAQQEIDNKLLTHNKTVPVTLPIYYTKDLPLELTFKEGGGATAVDVQVKFYIPAPEGSGEADEEITHIMVSGNKLNLDGITALKLATVDLGAVREGHTETIDLETLALFSSTGINNESGIKQIRYEITFPELDEKAFSNMLVETEGVPDGMQANVKTRRVDIVIRGSAALVNRLTLADISVIIDLSGAKLGQDDYAVKVVFGPGFETLHALTVDDITVDVIEAESEEA